MKAAGLSFVFSCVCVHVCAPVIWGSSSPYTFCLIDISPAFPPRHMLSYCWLQTLVSQSMVPSSANWKCFANSGILCEYNYYALGCKKTRKMAFRFNIVLQCPWRKIERLKRSISFSNWNCWSLFPRYLTCTKSDVISHQNCLFICEIIVFTAAFQSFIFFNFFLFLPLT